MTNLVGLVVVGLESEGGTWTEAWPESLMGLAERKPMGASAPTQRRGPRTGPWGWSSSMSCSSSSAASPSTQVGGSGVCSP